MIQTVFCGVITPSAHESIRASPDVEQRPDCVPADQVRGDRPRREQLDGDAFSGAEHRLRGLHNIEK